MLRYRLTRRLKGPTKVLTILLVFDTIPYFKLLKKRLKELKTEETRFTTACKIKIL